MNSLKIFVVVLLTGFFAACTKDLNRTPKYGLTTDGLYKDLNGYRSALAKIYGGLALTGNAGPDGAGDLGGIDEGFSSYLRNFWNAQELPTDEAVIAWNDQTIKDFHDLDWTAADVFNRALYSRIFYQITLANAFIRESADDRLNSRGITGADADEIRNFRAEARFLRALSYWHACDLFGNPTFVTEEDQVGAFLPRRITRAELFAYIETECLAIESLLPAPRQNEYARADQAACWMLLANLYLNAQVYTGTGKYTEAITYAAKVIGAGYTMTTDYANLFKADNHTSTEMIFPIAFDGNKTRTWGGTTFLVHAPVGGDMAVGDFGIDFGWGGLRTTKAFVDKFPDNTGNTDKRAMFQKAGQNIEIANIGEFRDGYSIRKWKNVTSGGAVGKSLTWPDTDFPLFRLAEAYLIYAEAVLRGGSGGSTAQALTYYNNVRQRAYGNTTGNATSIDLDDIIDERGREFQWEAKRRTDLVRFNLLTTSTYLWPWKGGVPEGRAVEAFRNIYPIPSPEINTNPNLIQNDGY